MNEIRTRMIRWFTLAFLLVMAYSVAAQERIPGRLIVQLVSNTPTDRFISDMPVAFARSAHMAHSRVLFESLNIHLVTFDEERLSFEAAVRSLSDMPSVAYVQGDHAISQRNVPNDPQFFEQWPLDVIRVDDVWPVTQGGQTINNDEVVIAVMDDGFQWDHEDLIDNIWFNSGEIPNDQIDNDGNGFTDDYVGVNVLSRRDNHQERTHGTSVAGIVGASGDNNTGIAGVNWRVKLMLISGADIESRIIEAYEYVMRHRQQYNETGGASGSFVVATNYSAGIDNEPADQHPLWCAVYDALGETGILSVNATANNAVNVDEVGDMPSTCTSPYLIAVTNSTRQDQLAPQTAYGPTHIDLAAPGDDTFTLRLNNGYGSFQGTSAASPHVAGAIALLYTIPCQRFIDLSQTDPAQTATIMKAAIMDGVDGVADLSGKTVSGGRLNVFNSMVQLASFCDGTNGDLGILNIYPNPTDQAELQILYETPDFVPYTAAVYTPLGQLVHSENVRPPVFGEKRLTLNINDFAQGLYYVCMYSDDGIACGSFFKR